MAIREVRTFPDPVLRQTAKPVVNITEEVSNLVHDMVDTMYSAPGVGLAAPQVGVSLRIVIIDRVDLPDEMDYMALINPEITQAEGSWVCEEGCLSLPGETAEVKRAMKITVRALDLSNQTLEIDAEGMIARIIQHEVDHLNGKLFPDRIDLLPRRRIYRRLRLAKEKQTGDAR